ncbi:MAG: mercuric resistance transcriptional repressor protein MerD [Paraburkholderia sp.]|uniref:mercuric resistance transcriptional repressor MerD n=1 Tax=Paraburkholderia sp. TaxID=1926495 RepID=UPI001212B0F9|nr:mercuric resistance transcriptional repressor MerD [Paraburkholderia sp.]TAM00979.1 MAG: mercuric resistance transcriptional repressor protein MerD [Paraburkholderia sp.]
MDGYTISRLADAAGVSVHVVREYVLRGLVHPVRRTPSGYGLYDEQALERLGLMRSLFEAGIGLDELVRVCRTLDADGDAATCLTRLRTRLTAQRKQLAALDRRLAGMVTAVQSEHARG